MNQHQNFDTGTNDESLPEYELKQGTINQS